MYILAYVYIYFSSYETEDWANTDVKSLVTGYKVGIQLELEIWG